MSSPLHVVWFKRDLRIHDHRPLTEAAKRGPVLPLYVVEPDLWRQPDASARQWQFISECIRELEAALGRLGQPLVVRVGSVVGTLENFRKSQGIAALWSHVETGNAWTFARDKDVAAWAREHSVAWHEIAQFGVQRRLRNRDGWAAAWDRQMSEEITDPPRALCACPGIWSASVAAARRSRH